MANTDTSPAQAHEAIREYFQRLDSDRIAFRDWAAGTVNGGPNNDGYYPFTAFDGQQVLLPSLPKLIQLFNGEDDTGFRAAISSYVDELIGPTLTSIEASETSATNSQNAAAASATTATNQATIATNAATTATDRAAEATTATATAVSAAADAGNASASAASDATTANLAAQAMLGINRVFTTTTLGIAGTTNGQGFVVIPASGATTAIHYYNQSGVAVASGFQFASEATRISFNVIITTGVTNSGNAYSATATGLGTLAAGQRVKIVPPATNTGVVTLSLNGGSARTVADAKGQALQAGTFEAGQDYELVYTGTQWRLHWAIRQQFFELTARSRLFLGTAGLVSLSASANGELIVTSSLNGVATELARFDFATGFLRVVNGLRIGATAGSAIDVYWRNNPQPFISGLINFDAIGETAAFVQSIERPDDSDPVIISSSKPYCATAFDLGRTIVVTAPGATIDLQKWTDGQSIKIATRAACTLYSGPDLVWNAQGATNTNMEVPANSMVTVTRCGSVLFYETSASVTFNAAAQAARDISIATIGQSLAAYFIEHAGIGGYQAQQALLAGGVASWPSPGWDSARSSIWPINAALGASALLEANNPSNFWWTTAGGPGPRATEAVTKINEAVALGQPMPALLHWVQGEGDRVGLAFQTTTYLQYRNAQVALFNWLRSQLGQPNLPIVISPLGADDTNAIAKGAYIAIREAQVWVCGQLSNVSLAPEKYDLPRKYTDVHLTYKGTGMMGARLALAAGNVLNGQNNDLGPSIQSFVGGSFTHVITFNGTTQPDRPGASTNPGQPPVGFQLRSPGDPVTATYYTIPDYGYAWSTNGNGNPVLTLTTLENATGCVLAYPGTSLQNVRTRRIVRGLFAPNLPLRTWGG